MQDKPPLSGLNSQQSLTIKNSSRRVDHKNFNSKKLSDMESMSYNSKNRSPYPKRDQLQFKNNMLIKKTQKKNFYPTKKSFQTSSIGPKTNLIKSINISIKPKRFTQTLKCSSFDANLKKPLRKNESQSNLKLETETFPNINKLIGNNVCIRTNQRENDPEQDNKTTEIEQKLKIVDIENRYNNFENTEKFKEPYLSFDPRVNQQISLKSPKFLAADQFNKSKKHNEISNDPSTMTSKLMKHPSKDYIKASQISVNKVYNPFKTFSKPIPLPIENNKKHSLLVLRGVYTNRNKNPSIIAPKNGVRASMTNMGNESSKNKFKNSTFTRDKINLHISVQKNKEENDNKIIKTSKTNNPFSESIDCLGKNHHTEELRVNKTPNRFKRSELQIDLDPIKSIRHSNSMNSSLNLPISSRKSSRSENILKKTCEFSDTSTHQKYSKDKMDMVGDLAKKVGHLEKKLYHSTKQIKYLSETNFKLSEALIKLVTLNFSPNQNLPPGYNEEKYLESKKILEEVTKTLPPLLNNRTQSPRVPKTSKDHEKCQNLPRTN
jgi:hypothetical protein